MSRQGLVDHLTQKHHMKDSQFYEERTGHPIEELMKVHRRIHTKWNKGQAHLWRMSSPPRRKDHDHEFFPG